MPQSIEMAAFNKDDSRYIIEPKRGGYPAPKEYEDIVFIDDFVPIAEDTTLPVGYYEVADIDTRYPRDNRRARLLEALASLRDTHPRTVALFEGWGAELKSLAPLFEPLDDAELDSDGIAKFLDVYENIRTPEEVDELNVAFYGTPRPLRFAARKDLGTYHEMLKEFSNLEGINCIVEATPVAELIEHLGIHNLRGEERIAAFASARPLIEELIADLRGREDEIIAGGGEEAKRLQSSRIFRETHIANSLDNFTYKQSIFNGVIANPAYLHREESYEPIHDEPEVQDEAKLNFFKHVMAGSWPYGHDHMYLYRSTDPDIAASHDGVTPDYGVIRPGNFVFHDFKLIEHGPYKEDFPLDALHTYVRLHFLQQADVHIGESDAEPGSYASFGHIAFSYNGKDYAVPLRRHSEHVLPFRALKKDLYTDEYYEYDTSCYLAELVDTALQFDVIEQKRGTADEEPHLVIGSNGFGRHAADLMLDMMRYKKNHTDEIATVIEQLLFMKGKQPAGGREAILAVLNEYDHPLQADLTALSTVDEQDDEGAPVGERLPLTCYYEWFQRRARPVPKEELERRGIPIVPALFSKEQI